MNITKEQRAEAGRLAHELEICHMPSIASFLRTIAAMPEAEPVAWASPHGLKELANGYPLTVSMLESAKHCAPLYAAPPPDAQQTARIAELEAAIVAMAEDGWLYCGPEGLSDAQQKCYDAYLRIEAILKEKP